MAVLINSDQLPRSGTMNSSLVLSVQDDVVKFLPFVPLKDLCGGVALNLLPVAPHLLELHSDLVERLCDDGDEDVLDQPRHEEDHGAEVERRLPVLHRVASAVHDVHPALLRGGLVHGEHALRELAEAGEALLALPKELSCMHLKPEGHWWPPELLRGLQYESGMVRSWIVTSSARRTRLRTQ